VNPESLIELAGKATKRPWYAVEYPLNWEIQDADDYEGRFLFSSDEDEKQAVSEERAAANAKYAVAACNSVPELCQRVLDATELLKDIDAFMSEPAQSDVLIPRVLVHRLKSFLNPRVEGK
jgi:hypothetical protein